mmetsp:Transcript_31357/g.66759  ORF Transcript_31357/g.66759 Transcript_31357/m.66759 type:complete len:383 (+) Transcript_31357:349-1497(+)
MGNGQGGVDGDVDQELQRVVQPRDERLPLDLPLLRAPQVHFQELFHVLRLHFQHQEDGSLDDLSASRDGPLVASADQLVDGEDGIVDVAAHKELLEHVLRLLAALVWRRVVNLRLLLLRLLLLLLLRRCDRRLLRRGHGPVVGLSARLLTAPPRRRGIVLVQHSELALARALAPHARRPPRAVLLVSLLLLLSHHRHRLAPAEAAPRGRHRYEPVRVHLRLGLLPLLAVHDAHVARARAPAHASLGHPAEGGAGVAPPGCRALLLRGLLVNLSDGFGSLLFPSRDPTFRLHLQQVLQHELDPIAHLRSLLLPLPRHDLHDSPAVSEALGRVSLADVPHRFALHLEARPYDGHEFREALHLLFVHLVGVRFAVLPLEQCRQAE